MIITELNEWEQGNENYAALTARIAQALEYVDISEKARQGVLRYLRVPELTVRVDMNLSFGHFVGWRVQHNSVAGPYKGGTRFHPGVTRDVLGLLSLMMTLKNSYLGLPLGGAKGGIAVDPLTLAEEQLEILTRRYTYGLRDIIGPTKDIPAPDVGTDGRVMAWMADAYRLVHGGMLIPSVVTGKPLWLGGIPGKGRSTGRGVAYVIRLAAEHFGYPLDGNTTVAVEGFGNVGSVTAEALAEMGCRIVAISDVDGALYNGQGIDIPAAIDWAKSHRGSIQGFRGGDSMPRETLLELPVDILSPCALEGSINLSNVDEVCARLIAGGANKYVTEAAERVLVARGVNLVDDRMTNGGGVFYSLAEWAQNREGEPWSERYALQAMYNRLELSWLSSLETQRRLSIGLHEAADVVSVEPLALALASRGAYL